MAFVHNVEIVWDDLMDAFTSHQGDRVHFLDRQTGEIFFVPVTLEDEEFWRQMESNRERFIEIPRLDVGMEHQLMSGFLGGIEDSNLKKILNGSITGRKPYGKMTDILSFFPDEHDRLQEMKDAYLTSHVKHWLEANNLYTVETEMTSMPRM